MWLIGRVSQWLSDRGAGHTHVSVYITQPHVPVGDVEEWCLGGDELVDVPPVLDDGVPEGNVEVAGHLF